MQNHFGQNLAVENINTPVYSSIDRRNSRSIGRAISYSVNQKCKPNHLGRRKQDKGVTNHYNDSGINHHDKSKVNQSSTLHGDKKTSDELNYIEVYFEPKPKERQVKIHGIEKKTNYVEIDFSKKACALAYDSDSDDDSAIIDNGKE
ncbi:Hypothetical predicted protein [Mytilus galloprovincialis]|uniref:Uncharacterized protein n=1 Tax=Mytilus galloprovincialis TaxID=29158 RepID=A0A8B6EUU3_MYTGA|nr:Hypothetical predicted protein [Mytilus galloprovincialis]